MLATPAGAKLLFSLSTGDEKSTFFLLKASLSAFGSKIGGPVLPKLFLTLFTFGASFSTILSTSKMPKLTSSFADEFTGQGFLVQDLTLIIADPRIAQDRAWALVGGFVIIYIGIAFSTYVYWEKVFSISVEYRAGLIGAM